ncbi:MAG: hypothetical protein ACM3RP_04835 [Chitinophagales bacterium]
MYKQYNEKAAISLEQGTASVPDDGRFYLLRDGEVIEAYPSLKRAQTAYKKLVDEVLSLIRTASAEAVEGEAKEKRLDPVKESTERFLDAKDAYWANSHKYRRGGRLGRR